MNTANEKENKAVAIQWENEESIPFVAAVGQGLDATAILTAAVEAKVPILNNPLLMSELIQLQQSQEIPPHLYVAVAQILAFVRFMEGKLDPHCKENNDDFNQVK